MPGFKCQAKLLFRELRVRCALSVFAMLLLSHVNASAQSVPSCAWRLESIGGSGSFNAFYPDTDASYWTMPVDTAQWKQVILQGQYPQSRFFSFTTYVAKGSTADGIYDINIDPDVGSSNPFRRGSSGQQDNYTVNVVTTTADFTDNPTNPGSLTVGGSTSGTLTNVGQDDWIAVSLTANQAYEFTITGAGASIGLASNLSGATFASSIPAADVGLSAAGTQYMYFMPSVSGTYYLDVSDAFGPVPDRPTPPNG